MASLSYMIYQENRSDKNAPISSSDDRFRSLFSSFRQKSVPIEPEGSENLTKSMQSLPQVPPKLRELIQESGILEELQQHDDVGPDVGVCSREDQTNSRPPSMSVDNALRNVVDEVLTIDNQEPLRCTCANGPCIYHSMITDDTFGTDDTSSTSSRRSHAWSFQEIPHYCTPQFEPQYLNQAKLSMKLEKSSPPSLDEMQPSRSDPKLRTSSRPPSTVDTRRNRMISTDKSLEKVDDDRDGSHFDHSIPRHNSDQTCQTMVSEVTWPYELISPLRLMRLDPRAPQFQIAREQEKHEEEVTVRTNNHSVLSKSDPTPPVRRPTPEHESPDPPTRKKSTASHHRASFPVTPDSEQRKRSLRKASSQVIFPVGRKGTIGGAAATQPLSLHSRGVAASPTTSCVPPKVITPREDSKPRLCPTNVISPDDNRSTQQPVSHESIKGPFVTRSAVKRRYRPTPVTPDHDSNPQLFPYGIGYYPRPPSRLPTPPSRMRSPLADPPRISLKEQLRPLLFPLEPSSSGDISRFSSQSSAQTSESTSGDEGMQPEIENERTNSVVRTLSVRAQLVPRKITFSVDGQERVHTGLYSGPIDRLNRMHGNGVFWFETGDVYLGQFAEDYLHGVGAMAIKTDDGSKQVLRGVFRKNEYIGTD